MRASQPCLSCREAEQLRWRAAYPACTPFSSSGRSGALRASSPVLALLQSPRCGGIHASARVCCVGGVCRAIWWMNIKGTSKAARW